MSATVDLRWPEEGVTRVPFRLYSDPAILAAEQERLFRGPLWHYLCLEIDVPNPGDYALAEIAETPIVVTRDEEGALHALINRCAHKGALVCLKERGHAEALTCVYHSWTYALSGELKSVAFRHGLRGKGGMPEDFDPAKHRLQPIRLTVFCGLIFGTFSDRTPDIETYLGPETAGVLRRNLGRKVKRIGRHSQLIHNNWKLYAENVRDSYHATLLHTFYTTFKVNRLDMDGGMILSADGRHSLSYAKRDALSESDEYAKVHSAQYKSGLHGPELLDGFTEFDDGITHMIQTVFPTLTVQLTLNSLAVRFFTPRGVDKTELHWNYLAYDDDPPELVAIRARQANLTGAAGLVSLEDGCINEFVQRGARGSEDATEFLEMGGRDVASSDGSRATETAIRGFWQAYRGLMGW
ncbi:MAG: Rieske 2Fe-2S domain-containing protein [Rhodospirillales bacterium]|nr:Rieske 2Fe-2S domain-containing protein [Rhodospirillales bacterium]